MANFWIIYERQENQANVGAGSPAFASMKLAAQRPRESETKARWSGNPELCKTVLLEAGTEAEAKAAFVGMFPGANTQAFALVEENKFKEAAA